MDRLAGTGLGSEEGASAVEYGLFLALVAGVIIGTVTTMGTQVAALFTSLVGQF